jgi:uncharacterized protein (TIGR02246 family)
MRIRRLFCLAVAVPLLAAGGSGVAQKDDKGKPEDEAVLLKNARAFVEAFHKGDAKAVAAFWTEDGDYTDQIGHVRKGREAITRAFEVLFAEHKGLKLRIDIASLRFVTPDVAVEDGTTSVIPADGAPPSRTRYTIVHTRKDGKWFLSSVREAPYVAPTNYLHLRHLEWALGEWADEAGKGDGARITYAWGPNQNFIVSTFTTSFKNLAIGGGTQWIGYDPINWGVRSWNFESNGGYGEGTWTRDGDKWTIKTKAVLPDGKQVVATSILTHVDADTLTLQSKGRTVDGKPIPDAPELRLKRVK